MPFDCAVPPQVLCRLFAWGGLAELYGAAPQHLPEGRVANSFAEELGAFGVPPSELGDMLAGTRISGSGRISVHKRQWSGDCSPEDLEVMMQLLHRLFTNRMANPPEERSKLRTVLELLREQVRAVRSDPHRRVPRRRQPTQRVHRRRPPADGAASCLEALGSQLSACSLAYGLMCDGTPAQPALPAHVHHIAPTGPRWHGSRMLCANIHRCARATTRRALCSTAKYRR